MALWAPPATLLSILLRRDSAPIQVSLVDSGKLLEGKWLILSKQTETGCVLVYRTRLILLPATGG